jgi:hypothetical protein
MLKSIEEEWLGFAAIVLPPSERPGSVQYDEMKKAFFAGAWSLHMAVIEIGEPHVSEEEGCEFLTKLTAEINEFKTQMMREYGERN